VQLFCRRMLTPLFQALLTMLCVLFICVAFVSCACVRRARCWASWPAGQPAIITSTTTTAARSKSNLQSSVFPPPPGQGKNIAIKKPPVRRRPVS
jgi:hypothetical protein